MPLNKETKTVVSEFELHLRYHVHFRNNIIGKAMIGLVSLFNGISTFLGYLMSKPPF